MTNGRAALAAGLLHGWAFPLVSRHFRCPAVTRITSSGVCDCLRPPDRDRAVGACAVVRLSLTSEATTGAWILRAGPPNRTPVTRRALSAPTNAQGCGTGLTAIFGLSFPLVSRISRDEAAHLARLSRLALTDGELDSLAGQLDAILTHVSQVQAVDVTGVEATGNPLRVVNVTRADDPAPCLMQAEALAEAPEAVDGRFAVPQILGDPE